MTPVQFARKWCANYQGDGSCLRAELVSADGRKRIFKPLARCALNAPLQRCLYFEEAVLPQNFKLDPNENYNAEQRTRLARNQQEQDEASREYHWDVLASAPSLPDLQAAGRGSGLPVLPALRRGTDEGSRQTAPA